MTTDKKSSNSSKNKKNIMFAYGIIQLSTSVISALALVFLALGFCSVKKESKLFNECVNQVVLEGETKSSAVRYCNGG